MSDAKTEELLQALLQIWENEEFAIEILEAIKGNTNLADKLLTFLKNGSELVPSEVYDELTVLTDGEFVKKFPAIRSLKKACIDCTEQSEWDELLKELSSVELFMVCEWRLTAEEEETILNASIGDTVHIDSQVEPLLLMDSIKDIPLIPVYTSGYEIPCKYREGDFIIQTVDWEYVQIVFNACKHVMNDALIVLDIDSDDFLEIDDDKLSV